MVLGMSVGTSDDKSGVGNVIGMSGPCASEMSSQWLGSRHQRPCTNEKIILTHMSANHPDPLIWLMVGLLEGLRSRHCKNNDTPEHSFSTSTGALPW